MSQATYGAPSKTYGDATLTWGGPTEWTLLSGTKGPAGRPLLLASRPFRKFAAAYGSGAGSDQGSFGYGYRNYGQGHLPVQWCRDSSGRVMCQGLAYAYNYPDVSNVVYLPWDMWPNPWTSRVVSSGNCNNQRARVDIYYAGAYGMACIVDQSAVVASYQTFTQINAIYQTYVPSCWVDFGCKAEGVPVGTTQADFTIGPGQVSGIVKGQPMTLLVPAQTVRLTAATGVAGASVYGYLFVDMVAQAIGTRLVTVDTTNINTNYPITETGPDGWMALAEEGKVVLQTFSQDYTTGGYPSPSGQAFRIMEHRWFPRDPSDWGFAA